MNAATSMDLSQGGPGAAVRNPALHRQQMRRCAPARPSRLINPATGKALAKVAEGDAADVDLAVAAARRSFEKGSWANMAPRERKKVLLRFADLIERT